MRFSTDKSNLSGVPGDTTVTGKPAHEWIRHCLIESPGKVLPIGSGISARDITGCD